MRSIFLAAASAAILLPGLAFAQDVTNSSDTIDTVTIIGKRIDLLEIPGSAHIVDTEALAEFAQADILRVLRSVPGVYVQEEEGYGLRPNIGIRGSGLDRSARIALLEDGILIAPAPYAASSAYYFPTQRRMSAVEVLKGPAAVAVGPRTTGGALNMISTPIPDSMDAMADIRFGDNNSLDAHVNVGDRGERVSWLLETVQASSDGFKSIEGPIGGDTGFTVQDYVAKIQIDNDPRSALYQSLRVKIGLTDQVSDETYLGLTDADFAATPYHRYAASANDNFRSEHQQYQATYVLGADTFWRGEVSAYRNNFSRNWYKLQSVAGVNLNTVLLDPLSYGAEVAVLEGATSADDAIQIRANNRDYFSQGLQARIVWDLSVADTQVSLAGGFRLHEDEEDRFQHQDGYRMQAGELVLTTAAAAGSQTNRVSRARVRAFFLDSEIRRGHWIFSPGLRFEDIELTRDDYATTDPLRVQGPARVRNHSVQVLIPGAGALYRLNDHWRLLAGVHKGFNPPTPGSSANEESSVNIEAGVRYRNNALQFESIYFRNNYDNLVGTVTDSTGGGGQIGDQFDAGKVIVSGMEMSADYSLEVAAVEIPLSLQYTWTNEAEFRNAFDSGFEPWGQVQIGDTLPYIPEHQLRASAGVATEQFRFSLAANLIGEMRTVAGQGMPAPQQRIARRIVWDSIASWRFSERLSSYVKIDNMFDKTYVAARRPAGSRPGLPRTAYIGLTFRL